MSCKASPIIGGSVTARCTAIDPPSNINTGQTKTHIAWTRPTQPATPTAPIDSYKLYGTVQATGQRFEVVVPGYNTQDVFLFGLPQGRDISVYATSKNPTAESVPSGSISFRPR